MIGPIIVVIIVSLYGAVLWFSAGLIIGMCVAWVDSDFEKAMRGGKK